ncbi:DUF317 domain-containing protein [Streptomyces sp. NPDC047081]|uniref:DUF317 domain-containing protein n=1 Tax=Streptomyces sp. NPDC047081 TaxID=3154706 RepID=UPI0034061523
MTDAEHQAAQTQTAPTSCDTTSNATVPALEGVPAYAADPGDHEAMLDGFFTENGDWEKYRTWDDNTTIASHESLTLRALFDHDAQSRDPKWTIAAYETPVSGLLWQMTVAAATPAPVLSSLLAVLAAGGAWDAAIGNSITPRMIAQVTRPLTDAGWRHTTHGQHSLWQTPPGDAGITLDSSAVSGTGMELTAWTLWAGPTVGRPTWAIDATADTPAGLLAHLAEEIAHGIGTRRTVSRPGPAASRQHTAALPPTAPPPRSSASLR